MATAKKKKPRSAAQKAATKRMLAAAAARRGTSPKGSKRSKRSKAPKRAKGAKGSKGLRLGVGSTAQQVKTLNRVVGATVGAIVHLDRRVTRCESVLSEAVGKRFGGHKHPKQLGAG